MRLIFGMLGTILFVMILSGCEKRPQQTPEKQIYIDSLGNGISRYVDCASGKITIYDKIDSKVIESTLGGAMNDKRCKGL